MKNRIKILILIVAFILPFEIALAQDTTRYNGPIIDMHLHGYTEAAFPKSSPPNMATGQKPVQTAQEHMEQTIEVMRRHNIVLGAICSVPVEGQAAMDAWAAYAPRHGTTRDRTR